MSSEQDLKYLEEAWVSVCQDVTSFFEKDLTKWGIYLPLTNVKLSLKITQYVCSILEYGAGEQRNMYDKVHMIDQCLWMVGENIFYKVEYPEKFLKEEQKCVAELKSSLPENHPAHIILPLYREMALYKSFLSVLSYAICSYHTKEIQKAHTDQRNWLRSLEFIREKFQETGYFTEVLEHERLYVSGLEMPEFGEPKCCFFEMNNERLWKIAKDAYMNDIDINPVPLLKIMNYIINDKSQLNNCIKVRKMIAP